MTFGVSLYGKVIESVGEESAEKIFGHESHDVTAGRRKASNEKPRVIEWLIYEG